MEELAIRPVTREDRPWIKEHLEKYWGGDCIVTHGDKYFPHLLLGLVAEDDDGPVGIISYLSYITDFEVILLEAFHKHEGIGTALLQELVTLAKSQNVRRLSLCTTNDNLDALRFYQRRGFTVTRVHPGSMIAARRIKPGIPEIGDYNIPMTSEFELQLIL